MSPRAATGSAAPSTRAGAPRRRSGWRGLRVRAARGSARPVPGEPRGPAPTVDVIIELPGGDIVLIERRYQPPGWALPGGFVELGETAEEAAARAFPESGLPTPLAFDHARILADYFSYRRSGRRPAPGR